MPEGTTLSELNQATPATRAQPIKPRTNHIFVDFENVQENELDRLTNRVARVTFVLGERHKNLPVAFVKGLLKHAGQVALVETGRSGKNALDLVLAQHIGEARNSDPEGYFHIISKDKDFDALIGHLRANGVLAARHASFRDVPVLMNNDERVNFLADHYHSKSSSRAKKRKALESQIQTLFGRVLSATELDDTINGLIAKKVLEIGANGEIAYRT
jgi:hypothetical protein